MNLKDIFMYKAKQIPDALAVQDPTGCVTYGVLDHLANCFAQAFALMGVLPGDRVGIWLEKSAYAVAAMQAILRLEAAYVPLDPLSPIIRICTILRDCDVRALVTTRRGADAVLAPEHDLYHVGCLCIDSLELSADGKKLAACSEVPFQEPLPMNDEIVYILYTSGSTGKPKGVCISSRNALAFIEWAIEVVQATPDDRFANHAPFHFDLSVLDLYVAFSVGALVCLIPDGTSYMPIRLVEFLLHEEPTIWYSVPSVLILMMEQGGLLDIERLPLRALLYAGESFPVKYVRCLSERWPALRILNLYGPTETNVCTFYEVQRPLSKQMRHIPIGKACSGNRVWAQKEDGIIAHAGEQGELMVDGPTVMLGYWGQPGQGKKPYATGDIVRVLDDGSYVCIGRRDQMVKVRGYRVELGAIEAALEEHAAISEAAVQVVGTGIEARLVASVVLTNTKERATLLEIKRHCAERLPRYMIVDAVRFFAALPRTRNGKIDRPALSAEQ